MQDMNLSHTSLGSDQGVYITENNCTLPRGRTRSRIGEQRPSDRTTAGQQNRMRILTNNNQFVYTTIIINYNDIDTT